MSMSVGLTDVPKIGLGGHLPNHILPPLPTALHISMLKATLFLLVLSMHTSQQSKFYHATLHFFIPIET